MKEHLIVVHNWSEDIARTARTNFGLNKNRAPKSEDKRKCKLRSYPLRKCPFVYCQKILTQMDNHLAGTHKLKGPQYKKMLKHSKVVQSHLITNIGSGMTVDIIANSGVETEMVLDSVNFNTDSEETTEMVVDSVDSSTYTKQANERYVVLRDLKGINSTEVITAILAPNFYHKHNLFIDPIYLAEINLTDYYILKLSVAEMYSH